MTIIIGIDPGLRYTGWGIIKNTGNQPIFVDSGRIATESTQALPERLLCLYKGLESVLTRYQPEQGAVEQIFVNKDAVGSLKLGYARAVSLLVSALLGIRIAEYAPTEIKKTIVGSGRAQKAQIRMMVHTLLPQARVLSPDAADALATALCHAHYMSSRLSRLHREMIKP